MAVESLELIADVQDQFSSTLDELSGQLVEVGLIADEVFPIDVDARGVASTESELASLAATAESIDDDISIGTSVDSDTLGAAASASTPDGGGSPTVATPDGGGGGFLDEGDLANLRRAFGDAFDASVLADRGGEVSAPSQLLEGGLDAHVDSEGLLDALLSDESGIGLGDISGLTGTDLDEFTESLETLKGEGLVDLPQRRRGFIQQLADIELKMGDFYQVLAGIMPILLTFVGALPAIIGGLVALGGAAISAAGALAAFGGIGLLGLGMQNGQFSMEPLRDAFSDLKDSFMEAFSPLATQLAPTIRTVVSDIELMFDSIATQARYLRLLREEFTGFFGFMGDLVGQAIAGMSQFADVASPILGQIGDWLLETSFTQIFADMLGRTYDWLLLLGDGLMSFLTVLMELSYGFLYVTTYIFQFIDVVSSIFNRVPGLITVLGALAGTMMTIVGVSSLLSTVGGAVVGMLQMLGLGGLFASSGLMQMQMWELHAIASTEGLIGVLSGASLSLDSFTLSSIRAAYASLTLGQAIAGVMAAISLGVLGYMVVQMQQINREIEKATANLEKFGEVGSSMGGMNIGSPSGGGGGGGSYVNYNDRRTFEYNGNGSREDANRANRTFEYMGLEKEFSG